MRLQRNRRRHRAYALLAAIGLAFAWFSDVFAIISYASRAFAAYYALQCFIAAVHAYRSEDRRLHAALYALLAILGAAVTVFGKAVEGA